MYMKHSTIDIGIIDLDNNPFTHETWIEQGFGFTTKRQEHIENLFGLSFGNILTTKPENDNRYVAFVSIRWGFAKIENGKLAPTEKWFNRHLYNGHGIPLNSNKKLNP
jgi:hypothetical protein